MSSQNEHQDAAGSELLCSEIQLLGTGEVPEWVQIFQVGQWKGHPTMPPVTPEHLASAVDYFERHYRAFQKDIPVDYRHAT